MRFAIVSVLSGSLLGAGLLLLSVPVWLVVVILVILLSVVVWQLPYIHACLAGLPDKATPLKPGGFWRRRVIAVLLLLVLVVGAEAVWWAYNAKYPVSTVKLNDKGEPETDVDGERVREVTEYHLPLSYAFKKPLWQLGLAPLPTLVTIPAGSFQMGDDQSYGAQPVHEVTIKNHLAMSRTEITFAQYDYYVWLMQADGVETINYPHDEGWGRDNRPVINVSWEDAQGYVNWLSKAMQQQCRLPGEAEWEYAARAGTTTAYYWGDDIGINQANCDGCGSQWDNKQTAPVGSFPANAFGLEDMHGNVWEWVQDRWHDNYEDAPLDGRAWEAGDSSGRVLRGGSWSVTPDDLRSALRFNNYPVNRNDLIGFRVVCSPLSGR